MSVRCLSSSLCLSHGRWWSLANIRGLESLVANLLLGLERISLVLIFKDVEFGFNLMLCLSPY